MPSAKEFPTERIRNVAVLGHAGSGKTTLVDALCYAAGSATRKGNVQDGHAVTLTTPEEISHRVSMQLTPAFVEWEDTKINLLDTPGYLDFTGEAVAAVRAADAAIILVSATAGVEVGTEMVWEYCEDRGIPRMVVASMMDKEHADFDSAFQDVKERLTEKVVSIEIPIGSGESFRGLVNLFREQAHIYKAPDGKGEFEVSDVPEELQGRFEEWRTELQETLATLDEELLEQYLESGKIAREEAIQAMAQGMKRREVFPVLLGSGRHGYGTRALLHRIVQLLPNPAEATPETARPASGGDETITLKASDEERFAALVFKTTAEPHVGHLSIFRVVSGSVKNGAQVLNVERNASEKLNHLSVPFGKERPDVPELHAGDIGVVAKLRDTHTNDTLADSGRPVVLPGVRFPRPDITLAVRGVARSDEDKLGEVLASLREEDPCFQFEFNAELHQTIVRGLGELHLDVQIEKMARKYGVTVETEQPRIAYRETITRKAEAHGRFKKQTGGPWPVRGLLDTVGAPRAGRGLRVRELDQGRGDSGEVRALRGSRDPRGCGQGRARRLSGGRLQGGVLRRGVPRRGLLGHRLPGGRIPRVPSGGGERGSGPARADHGGSRHNPRLARGGHPRRHHPAAGEGPRNGGGFRPDHREGESAGGRALQVCRGLTRDHAGKSAPREGVGGL